MCDPVASIARALTIYHPNVDPAHRLTLYPAFAYAQAGPDGEAELGW